MNPLDHHHESTGYHPASNPSWRRLAHHFPADAVPTRAARLPGPAQEGSLQLQAMGFDCSEAKKALEARRLSRAC